jgi:hypothetical protein
MGFCTICGKTTVPWRGIHPTKCPEHSLIGQNFLDSQNPDPSAAKAEHYDSIMLAVKADRAAICDYILSCREHVNTVQVFDVMALHIREGKHLPKVPDAVDAQIQSYEAAMKQADQPDAIERCEGCGSTDIAGRTMDDVPLCSTCGHELVKRISAKRAPRT